MPILRTIQPRILNRLTNISPFELYKIQVKNNFDALRYAMKDMNYTPNQFGGLVGQRIMISEPTVMEVIEFEVT